jgi:threonine dehydrogenase-like Zn-dependent dehydrogenase
MNSIAVFPERKVVEAITAADPGRPGPFEAKLKVLEVGICGTDREIAAFEYGALPEHSDHLVLGHEALAEVVEVGGEVERFKPGDLVVPTVRRPCKHRRCWACRSGRQDFCITGDFTERGIKKIDGFLSQFVIEDESNLVEVPSKLRGVAVLIEPLSIAAKAGEQALAIGYRTPFPQKRKRALAVGAGPVGLLAAMVFQADGFETYVYSAEASTGEKAEHVRSFGATYVSAKETTFKELKDEFGPMDVIYEAVGITEVAFKSLEALAPNGMVKLTGIPSESQEYSLNVNKIMRKLVLHNELLFGTVNAGTTDYESAVSHLEKFMFLFPDSVRRMISRHPMSEAPELLRSKKGIKDIVEVTE